LFLKTEVVSVFPHLFAIFGKITIPWK